MTFRSACLLSSVSAMSKGEDALSGVTELPFPMSSSALSPKTVWAPVLMPLPILPLSLLLVATPFFLQFKPWCFFFPLSVSKPDSQTSRLPLPDPPTALPKDRLWILNSELRTRPSWLLFTYTAPCTERGWCCDLYSVELGVLDPDLLLITSVQQTEHPRTSVAPCLKSNMSPGRRRIQ